MANYRLSRALLVHASQSFLDGLRRLSSDLINDTVEHGMDLLCISYPDDQAHVVKTADRLRMRDILLGETCFSHEDDGLHWWFKFTDADRLHDAGNFRYDVNKFEAESQVCMPNVRLLGWSRAWEL